MPEITGEVLLHEYNFSISSGDIAQLDICKDGGCQNLSREELEITLYNNGLDLSQPYQVVHDTHRGITNKIFTTNRYVGFIRRDQKWVEMCGTHIEIVLDDLKNKKKYRGSEDMLDSRR
jgi:hypothetical protein